MHTETWGPGCHPSTVVCNVTIAERMRWFNSSYETIDRPFDRTCFSCSRFVNAGAVIVGDTGSTHESLNPNSTRIRISSRLYTAMAIHIVIVVLDPHAPFLNSEKLCQMLFRCSDIISEVGNCSTSTQGCNLADLAHNRGRNMAVNTR